MNQDIHQKALDGVIHGLDFLKSVERNALLPSDIKEHAKKAQTSLSQALGAKRLRLAVVGEFSSGKSSLINALLQEELLAADFEPTTAVATRLTWSPAFQITIHGEHIQTLWPEIGCSKRSLAALRKSIPTILSPEGELLPEHRASVSSFLREATTERDRSHDSGEVEIGLPSPYLAAAIDIIDTPGFNPGLSQEGQERHLSVTMAAVESAHLALFIIDGRNPLKSTEQRFLQKFKPHLSKVIFVVNKMDVLVDDDDDEEALDVEEYIQEELAEKFGLGDLPVSPYFVTSMTEVDEGAERFKTELSRLREDVVHFLEASRDMILLENAGRDLGKIAVEVRDASADRMGEESAHLAKLRALHITDPDAMAQQVIQVAMDAYNKKSQQFLKEFSTDLTKKNEAATRQFARAISKATDSKGLKEVATIEADLISKSAFINPVQRTLNQGLQRCIKASLKGMAGKFKQLYAGAKVPKPAQLNQSKISAIAQNLLHFQVSGGVIGQALDAKHAEGDGAAAMGAMGGAAVGVMLLGPVGLLGAGLGYAFREMFGPSLDSLKQKATEEFSQQLHESATKCYDLAAQCLGGRHPVFTRLMDEEANRQITAYQSAVIDLQKRHEMKIALSQQSLGALVRASETAESVAKEAKARAGELRDTLARQTISEKRRIEPLLDEEAVSRIARMLLGAVKVGAIDLANKVARWLAGDGVRLATQNTQPAQWALLRVKQSDLMREFLEGQAIAADWKGSDILDVDAWELTDLDLALLCPSRAKRTEPALRLVAAARSGKPLQKPDDATSSALTPIEQAVAAWKEIVSDDCQTMLFELLKEARTIVDSAIAARLALAAKQARNDKIKALALNIFKWVLTIGAVGWLGYHTLTWLGNCVSGWFEETPAPPPPPPIVKPVQEPVKWSLGLEMVKIEKSQFKIGSPRKERGRGKDEKQRKVTLSHDFLIGKYEITQGQWQRVMGVNPSLTEQRSWSDKKKMPCKEWGVGSNLPVTCISWLEAIGFANALSAKEGLQPVYAIQEGQVTWKRGATGYRLPTEAEWELAARGDSKRAYGYTDQSKELCIGGNVFDKSAKKAFKKRKVRTAKCQDKHAGLAPVGQYLKNANGIHDMMGNVWEWTWDGYGSYKKGTDPMGKAKTSKRVIRGGSWYDSTKDLRIANRSKGPATGRTPFLGLRLVRNVGFLTTETVTTTIQQKNKKSGKRKKSKTKKK